MKNQQFTIDLPAQNCSVKVVIGNNKYIQQVRQKDQPTLSPGEMDNIQDHCISAYCVINHPIVVVVKTDYNDLDFDLVRSVVHEMTHAADIILHGRGVEFTHKNEIYPQMIAHLVSTTLKRIKQ